MTIRLRRERGDMPGPTRDETWCDLGEHQACPGYTNDESDPETCFCECHSITYYEDEE